MEEELARINSLEQSLKQGYDDLKHYRPEVMSRTPEELKTAMTKWLDELQEVSEQVKDGIEDERPRYVGDTHEVPEDKQRCPGCGDLYTSWRKHASYKDEGPCKEAYEEDKEQ